jgi:hypothetical protein
LRYHLVIKLVRRGFEDLNTGRRHLLAMTPRAFRRYQTAKVSGTTR